MSEKRKKYEKPAMEFVELPGNILLASGKDPFAGNDVRFSSVDEDFSDVSKKLKAEPV